ncbi:hypothetical protein MSPP1_000311 [Malassezia sp. CBS 17886]|nr:hypothetical protein MSPP1_000311 [Malassezia sp. CBS 17886]
MTTPPPAPAQLPGSSRARLNSVVTTPKHPGSSQTKPQSRGRTIASTLGDGKNLVSEATRSWPWSAHASDGSQSGKAPPPKSNIDLSRSFKWTPQFGGDCPVELHDVSLYDQHPLRTPSSRSHSAVPSASGDGVEPHNAQPLERAAREPRRSAGSDLTPAHGAPSATLPTESEVPAIVLDQASGNGSPTRTNVSSTGGVDPLDTRGAPPSPEPQRPNSLAASMNPIPKFMSWWNGPHADEGGSDRGPTDTPDAERDLEARGERGAAGGYDAEESVAGEGDSPEPQRRWSSLVTPSYWRRPSATEGVGRHSADMHSDQMVDYLDVLDPAVSVFNTLQNYGNSVMIPYMPWIYNRRPTLRIDELVGGGGSAELPSPDSPTGGAQVPAGRRGQEERRRPSAGAPRPLSPTLQGAPLTQHTAHRASVQSEGLETQGNRAESLKSNSDKSSNQRNRDDALSSHHSSVRSTSLLEKDEGEVHTDRWHEMDQAEREELEVHIRYLLKHKKTMRILQGFWSFVRTPMGFILTTYGLLLTGWGIFIFLLIVRWVVLGDPHRQRYWVEICDQVLCALFAAVGLGFAPFRAVDTFRMAYIAHYHFLTYKRRKMLHLPKLANESELPRYSPERLERLFNAHAAEEPTAAVGDALAVPKEPNKEVVEPAKYLEVIGANNARGGHSRDKYAMEKLFGPVPGQPGAVEQPPHVMQKDRLQRPPSIRSLIDKDTQEVSVLSPTQQATLQHQQRLFHESHTFYRYCETATHWPFPLRLMMAIVILLDCHSCLQAALGGITWGIKYEHRPTALTATIISCSLSCNAVAGILIWQGGKRTRKTDVVKRRLRIALEEQAIARMERKRRKAALATQTCQDAPPSQQKTRDSASDRGTEAKTA